MHHVVAVQEGHPGQDLLGQPDHVFLCEGLVVIGNALVEDFPPSSTVGRSEGIQVRTEHDIETTPKHSWFGLFVNYVTARVQLSTNAGGTK